ncbi:MAG: hydrogenase maturation protease [Bacteroidales bacterium]
MKDKILILGLGNLVLKDEGVGIHAVQHLEKEDLPDHVDLLDGGTGGVWLIGTLQEYKRVVMIDATLDNSPWGTIRVTKPRYSKDYPVLLSAHEFGLRDMVESMMIQECIPDIDLITISVKDYETIGMDLSDEVSRAIPEVIRQVKKLVMA